MHKLSRWYNKFDYDDTGWNALKWSTGIGSFGSTNQDNIVENNEVSYAGIRDDGYMPDPVNKGYGIWLDTNWIEEGHDIIVRNNIAHHNAASGLFCEKSRYTQWHYNIAYGNGYNGLRVDADMDADGNTHIVQNNTFYNNVLYDNNIGIYSTGGWAEDGLYTRDNIFKNNIAVGNSNRQLLAKTGGENDGTMGSGNVYLNNNFGAESSNFIEWGKGSYKSTYDEWETAYCGTPGCSNSVVSDPLLVDPSTNDFHLQLGSPAINAGVDVGLTQDFDGNPIVGIPDIGAFEYQGLQSTCTSEADTNYNNIIEIGELLTYISNWKSGGLTIGELLTGISEWKNGC